MARKETFTIDKILNTAFAIAREEGIEEVTARKVAAKAECSTQPIFRTYKNMDELWGEVYNKAVVFFHDYYSLYPKSGRMPFSNLGMAYISFAREEKKLFELLFLHKSKYNKTLYEVLNAEEGNVMRELSLAAEQGCKDPEALFMKMWIFIHGAACMTLTGEYDLSDAETVALLEDSYKAFSTI